MMAEEKGTFRSGYVSIIGAPNVGKSTLLNCIIGEKVSIISPKPQTTRNRITGIYNGESCQIIFIDTPGIHEARDMFNSALVSTAISAIEDVDVICFMVEPNEKPGKLDMFILEEVLSKVSTPSILVINKIDTLKNKALLLPIIDIYKDKHPFEAIIPISALLGDGVRELVDSIARLLSEGPKYFPEDYVTDLPERFLVAELIREQVFNLTHEEVPYSVFVIVDSFQKNSEKNLVSIDATINVEKESQKGIIIGKNGRMIKEIGKNARKDIERLLGVPVYLNLYVRVKEKWRRNISVLNELGFKVPRPKK